MHETPQSSEDAAALIRRAPRKGWNLLATGTGIHLETGDADEDNMVRVGTAGFAGIREHTAADMTVSVGAGTRLGELAEHLDRAGQWLPIDPPKAEETTVGGLLAANLSGPLRASQGRARDLLLGIHTLDGRGDLIKGGGKVVKNVAGYDLPRLHVGACGGLGLILEATFQIRPRPALEHAWVALAADAESAMTLAFAMRAAAEPGWLELAGPGVFAADGVTVVAGAFGGSADVESAIAAWRGVAADGRLEESAAALRRRLADATAATGSVVLKAALLPSRLGALL
ncbi:MAG: FAD-binding oxidoreductase, partial [bacterium]